MFSATGSSTTPAPITTAGVGQAIVTLTPAGDLHMQAPLLDALGVPYNPILQPVSRDNFAWQVRQNFLLLTGLRGSGNEMEHLRLRPLMT